MSSNIHPTLTSQALNDFVIDGIPTKMDKYSFEDHESEISKWLKLENDPLPPIGNSSTYNIFTLPSLSNTNGYISSSGTGNRDALSGHTSTSLNSTTSNGTNPSGLQVNPQSSAPTLPLPAENNRSCSNDHQHQLQQFVMMGSNAELSSSHHYASNSGHYPANSCNTFTPHYTSLASNGASSSQYSNPSTTYSTHFSPTPYTIHHQNPAPKQFSHQNLNHSFYPHTQPNYLMTSYPTQTYQYNPNHMQQNFSSIGLPDSVQQMPAPQLYQLFAQFQQIIKNGTAIDGETPEEKKRRTARTVVRRVRQTRPKVVESKGSVQCKGKNRKKGIQCRNAALMEYIGPRPIYCAEHIELDPRSLYEKCKSTYQKEVGDNKGCKEVVLKEFGVCYKHYPDLMTELIEKNDTETIRKHYQRINDLLCQLEKDAAAAKKKDGDLYQRKNKLIPKFQEMKKIISKTVEQLNIQPTLRSNKEDADISPNSLDESQLIGNTISTNVFEFEDQDVDDFTDVSSD